MFATYFGHCILPYVLFPTGNVIIFSKIAEKPCMSKCVQTYDYLWKSVSLLLPNIIEVFYKWAVMVVFFWETFTTSF